LSVSNFNPNPGACSDLLGCQTTSVVIGNTTGSNCYWVSADSHFNIVCNSDGTFTVTWDGYSGLVWTGCGGIEHPAGSNGAGAALSLTSGIQCTPVGAYGPLVEGYTGCELGAGITWVINVS
jgi:hypothetical protein